MLLALLVEFAVAPRIVARENLALWHSVGSAMYLLQWLCAGCGCSGKLTRNQRQAGLMQSGFDCPQVLSSGLAAFLDADLVSVWHV